MTDTTKTEEAAVDGVRPKPDTPPPPPPPANAPESEETDA